MKRNILTIFLASPGDLKKEREITREAVERFNQNMGRRIGWNVELLGWEDTLPGYNRPQSLINKDVDSCDLFIGMLWKRWGQPTGEYSSGFEEEFERVKNRKKETPKPEIWLLFKVIDDESKKDPGVQLKKVLSFRKEQIQKKELYFKEFDEEKFNNMIFDHLIAYVMDLTSQEKEETQSSKEKSESSQTKVNIGEDNNSKDEKVIFEDLTELFSKLNKPFSQSVIDQIDFWDKTRLFLAASAWYSKAKSHEIFRNHEINLIFFKRNEWTLSFDEKWLIFRSIISDEHNLRPGWCWLTEYDENYVVNILNWISTNDNEKNIRKQSITKLAQIGVCPREEIIESCLKDEEEVVLATLNLLKEIGKTNHIELIKKIPESTTSNIKKVAEEAYVEILYRQNPTEAFTKLIENSGKITESIKKSFENSDIKFDEKLLYKSLTDADSSVRRYSAEYLAKTNKLDKENCQQILKDTDSQVRKIGLIRLIELGEDISIDFCKKLFPEPKKEESTLFGLALRGSVCAEDFLPHIYKNYSPEKLLGMLEFYQIDIWIAYRVLATQHYEYIRDSIRKDLDLEFESLKNETDLKMQNTYGEAVKEQLRKFEPFIDYMKGEFIGAALEGLAINGEPDDLKYARKYLNSKYSFIQDPAISIIAKFGDESDVEALRKTAKDISGDRKINALTQAFALSNKKEDLLDEMINEEDKTLLKQAALFIRSIDHKACIEKSKKILYHKNDDVRLIGLSILVEKLTEKELKTLLEEYIKAQSYYYNVVSWLDQILYSPLAHKEIYKNNLLNMTIS